jgi:hypothetical protein
MYKPVLAASSGIKQMKLYLDNNLQLTTPHAWIDSGITAAPGPHTITVKAVSNSGARFQRTVVVTAIGAQEKYSRFCNPAQCSDDLTGPPFRFAPEICSIPTYPSRFRSSQQNTKAAPSERRTTLFSPSVLIAKGWPSERPRFGIAASK